MIDRQLVQYIWNQLKAGYDANSVRQALINYGHTEQNVDESINYVVDYIRQMQQPAQVEHVVKISKGTILGVMGVILVLVFSVGFLWYILKPVPGTLLDIKVSPVVSQVKSGDVLEFIVELDNLGGRNRYDVELMFEVLDSGDYVVVSSTETVAVETAFSKRFSVRLPAVDEGKYRLVATAIYDDKTAVASFSFDVVSEVVDDVEKVEGDVDKVEDVPAVEEPVVEREVVKTKLQVMDDVRVLSVSDAGAASALCSEFDTSYDKDQCYTTVAKESGLYQYCASISVDDTRDLCYMEFVYEEDVCENIVGVLKMSCESVVSAPVVAPIDIDEFNISDYNITQEELDRIAEEYNVTL